MSITAIITMYRRPYSLAPLLEALRGQSVPPKATWAWANEPQRELSAALAAAGLDRVVTSSDNAYFHGRFALALLAETDYVALFDDDSIPGPRWFENCLDTIRERPGILGTAGLVLAGAGYSQRTMHGWQRPSDTAVEVDFVCQAWFLRREWLHYLFAAPPVTLTNGEDIELATRAWRLGKISSFCPPHPAADRSLWGSTQGMELGLDAAAASRRAGHEAERDGILRAEIAAGWQPLFMRDGSPPGRQNPGGEQQTPSSEDEDAVNLDGTLEREADPLAYLRRLRERSPSCRVTCCISNVRHHRRLAGLLLGQWTPESTAPGSHPHGADTTTTSLRFYTRREIEKLFYRAGYEIEQLRPVANNELRQWQRMGQPQGLDFGGLRLTAKCRAEAEEFLAERFDVAARSAVRTDHGLTSIILVTHNQIAFSRACLESVRCYTDEPHEIIIVDNGSTDGTVEYFRSLAGVNLIEHRENRGFPAAANQGIRAAGGRQVLLLNNDILVTTGWLGRLLEALASDRRIGLVGPVSNHVSGEQQIDAGYDDLAGLDGFAWDWARDHRREYRDVERLVGFCLLIRRELVDSIGLLDERFGIGNYEDDDFCRRARSAGYRAVIARDSFIHHFGHRSFAAAGIDLNALLEQNRKVYQDKWGIEESPGSKVQGPKSGIAPAVSDGHAEKPVTYDQGPRQLTLSLCMIVRDNAGTIRAALESIKPWVDEMIVVDTGSTDATPEICRELGAQVHHFPWRDSFSLARNESLCHARGRWIFWMDSDDVIDEANGRKLRELSFREPPAGVLGYIMQVHCPGAGDGGRHGVTVVDHCKMFLNRPELRFEGRIHEQVLERIRRAGGDVAFTDIFVVHAGADHTPEGRRRKLRRDIRLLHLDRRERPEHPFVHFNLGMTYADAGKHRKAIRSLRRSLELSQPHESHVRKVYALLVASYRELGLTAEACQAVSEGMTLYPKDPELLFRGAMLAHEDGRLAEAERCYLAALANDDAPHFASFDRGIVGFKARHNLAAVYTDMGALDKAEAQWRRIVAEVPGYADGWQGLIETLLARGETGEAHTVAGKLAGEKRSRCMGLMLLAATAQARGDLQAARCGLLRAVQEFPEAVGPLRRLGRLLFDHGHPSEAQVALGKLTELDPSDAAAHHNLGTAALRNGDAPCAVEALQASLRLRPGFAPTQLSRGYALHELGRTAEAIHAFESCLRLASDGPLAAEARRQLTAAAEHMSVPAVVAEVVRLPAVAEHESAPRLPAVAEHVSAPRLPAAAAAFQVPGSSLQREPRAVRIVRFGPSP